METLDLLEEVLADYSGTLLLVSHDRDFLDRLVGSVIAVEGGGEVAEYVGGYRDYLRQRPDRPAGGGAKPEPSRPGPADARPDPKPKPRAEKLGYKDRRELDALPGRIEALGAEIARLEAELADPALYERDPGAFAAATERLAAAQGELAAAEDRWLELAELEERLSAR
jgi:ATP-binding cassette subfamily F protein uup